GSRAACGLQPSGAGRSRDRLASSERGGRGRPNSERGGSASGLGRASGRSRVAPGNWAGPGVAEEEAAEVEVEVEVEVEAAEVEVEAAEIGRASCREGGESAVVAVGLINRVMKEC